VAESAECGVPNAESGDASPASSGHASRIPPLHPSLFSTHPPTKGGLTREAHHRRCPHGRDRRRQDLRPRPPRLHPHPHRRTRLRRHRIADSGGGTRFGVRGSSGEKKSPPAGIASRGRVSRAVILRRGRLGGWARTGCSMRRRSRQARFATAADLTRPGLSGFGRRATACLSAGASCYVLIRISAAGIWSHVRPSRIRPASFLLTPPHCLKKNGMPADTH